MPLQWNAQGDFESVIDTLENVKLYRCKNGGSAEVLEGWRFEEAVDSPYDRGGAVRRHDVTWQLPIRTSEPPPEPGDVVIDGGGGCSIIRTVSRLRGGTRYTCATRRTEISPEFAERFDLERPILEVTSEGTEIVGWRVERTALVGCITSSDEIDPQGSTAPSEVTVTLLEPLDVREGDRIRRHQGGVFDIIAWDRGDSIGEPYRLVAAAAA